MPTYRTSSSLKGDFCSKFFTSYNSLYRVTAAVYMHLSNMIVLPFWIFFKSPDLFCHLNKCVNVFLTGWTAIKDGNTTVYPDAQHLGVDDGAAAGGSCADGSCSGSCTGSRSGSSGGSGPSCPRSRTDAGCASVAAGPAASRTGAYAAAQTA